MSDLAALVDLINEVIPNPEEALKLKGAVLEQNLYLLARQCDAAGFNAQTAQYRQINEFNNASRNTTHKDVKKWIPMPHLTEEIKNRLIREQEAFIKAQEDAAAAQSARANLPDPEVADNGAEEVEHTNDTKAEPATDGVDDAEAAAISDPATPIEPIADTSSEVTNEAGTQPEDADQSPDTQNPIEPAQ